MLKGGKATTDAAVANGVFTASAAGTYVVKATQAADGTYCEVVKEVTITVTDNRPAPAEFFHWQYDGATVKKDSVLAATGGTVTLKSTDASKNWGTESIAYNASVGGGWYDRNNNYSGLKAWSALTNEDRKNFSFNYDALDLLIDTLYSGDTRYYDDANGNPVTQVYSAEKPLDYNALYIAIGWI